MLMLHRYLRSHLDTEAEDRKHETDVRSGRSGDEERTEQDVGRYIAPPAHGLRGDTRLPRRGRVLGSIGRVCCGGV